MVIWICWRFVIRKGNLAKVPFSAYGGQTGTDYEHRSTWATYEEAMTAKIEQGYDGIGFVIPEGFFFLDLDHHSPNDPLARKLLERFDTYAEISVSGDGIHIYGECRLGDLPIEFDQEGIIVLNKDYYVKNPNNGIELYIGGITSRYAVYTGNALNNKSIRRQGCYA